MARSDERDEGSDEEAGGKGSVAEWRLRRLEEADRQRQALEDRHLGLGDFQALVRIFCKFHVVICTIYLELFNVPIFQVGPLSKDRDRNLDSRVLEDTDKIKPDSKLKNKGTRS